MILVANDKLNMHIAGQAINSIREFANQCCEEAAIKHVK